jgi:hypothetical protein
MEEPQAKRVRLDIADVQKPAVPGPDLLEDMTLGAAKTVVHHLESLQEAYMVRMTRYRALSRLADCCAWLTYACTQV